MQPGLARFSPRLVERFFGGKVSHRRLLLVRQCYASHMPTNIAITPEVVREHNLTGEEYQKVLDLLGRKPTITELGIFSVMWSEHCSYKSSRVHLKRLPTRSRRVVQGPGE